MATDARETKHDMQLEVTVSKGPERRRQGKFQPFKRLFGKRKKREAQRHFTAAELKASFSTEEVCNGVVSDDEAANQNLRELNPIGSRALSHESIFTPEEPAKVPDLDQTMSQENVSDKVKNLQRQIAQNIKFGQKPPSLRRHEGDEGSSDEEEFSHSPLKVLAQVEAGPTEMEPKQTPGPQQARTPSTPVRSPRSKRVLLPSGTIESINLDAVSQSVTRLDNTAAKHKLAVKPKNQRVSRKHRRFTQDLQDLSLPDVLQEDEEAAGASTEDPQREPREISKKQRLQEEERRESWRRKNQEEQRLRLEEEERRKAEELRLSEQQEEQRLRREQEERQLREEEERMRKEDEKRRRIREEEERQRREEQERRQKELEEEEKRREEDQRRREEDERKRREEERRQREEREEEETKKKLEAERRMRELEEEERKRAEEEQRRSSTEDTSGPSDPQEKKRKAEELRWRELEERQRPFSFKVSSGEKQILFQKVNLTPVTPASGHQGGAAADQREGATSSPPERTDSPNLPSSQYVPHTAILVTGAQLCGTAVNMDQIKDTACKSLLGLGEDRKAQGTPPTKSKISPDRKSAKTKSLNEALLSTDQSSAAVLAEWASIRSKIFKGTEEYPIPCRSQTRPSSEDLNQPPFSHANLRKTMSASAKFSITPAKKKFGDSNRNSELLSPEEGVRETLSDAPEAASPPADPRSWAKPSKTARVAERGSEECMFAKDLPSFLVPSSGAKPEGAGTRSGGGDPEGREEGEGEGEGGGGERRAEEGEDTPSPFGIKLRRTNFSLRFHGEQSSEKRRKRYSAGDSFDGVPSPLAPMAPMEPDADPSPASSHRPGPASPPGDGRLPCATPTPSPSSPTPSSPSTTSPSAAAPQAKATCRPFSAAPHVDVEKTLSAPPVHQRAEAAVVPTPPHSPLPKSVGGEGQRTTPADRAQGSSAVAQLQRSGHADEEPKEKKSFFPSLNIPWREKMDRKTELMKKEKPSLQSRHSLDSSRVHEKAHEKAQEREAGPLWITLALQKQKGFREQQQSREDRRSQREAKLAEKQSRDRDSVPSVSPSESKGSGSRSPSIPQTTEDPKRPDSLLVRFERRDHLKKANTLPSSVTVEITDSTPSPPAVKDVAKRFPSTDSSQVSTEPAWLALAKRKAKAWSDCPQIIK